jgi:hypothetical protein
MRFLLTIFLLIGLSIFLIAQSSLELESELIELQGQLQNKTVRRDSLKMSLEEQLQVVDLEKSKENINKNKVAKLMSEALETSKQVENSELEIIRVQNVIEQKKSLLDQTYAYQIDSLQTLVGSKNFDGDKTKVHAQIRKLTEMRLLLSPTIRMLSFDPEKVRQIQLENAHDSLEIELFTDYLRNALADVDAHLVQVQENRNELEEIILLEEKKTEFLDDVIEDRYSGIFLAAESQNQINTDQLSGEFRENPQIGHDVASESSLLLTQFQSYLNILQRLNINEKINAESSLNTPVGSGKPHFTAVEYLNLLKAVEKQLQQYQEIIIHKLNQ